jgi:hypothetical protein
MFFKIKKETLIDTILKNKLIFIVYFLFIVSTIPSILVSKSLIISCYTVLKFTIIPFLIIICLSVKPNNNDKKLFFTILTISSILLSFLSFIQYEFDIELLKEGTEKYPGAKGRVSATFFNTIYYGIFINLVSSIYLAKYLRSSDKSSSIYNYITLLILYVSLLLTFTRSAFLIFWGIVFILTLFLINKKNIVKFLALFLSIILLTFIIPGAKYMAYNSINNGFQMIFKVDLLKNNGTENNSSSSSYNLDDKNSDLDDKNSDLDNNKNETENNLSSSDTNKSGTKYGGDLSLIHREQFGDIAKKVGSDNFFSGIGFGAYMEYMNSEDFDILYSKYSGSKTHPHSSIILLFAESGIISVSLFFLFLFIILIFFFIKLLKNIKNKNNHDFTIYLCSFAISLGFIIINIIAENAIYDTQIFPLFIIIVFSLYNLRKIKC